MITEGKFYDNCRAANTTTFSLSLYLTLDWTDIEQETNHHFLGVLIDNKLSLELHVNFLCKTMLRRIFYVSKLRHIVDVKACKLMLVFVLNPVLIVLQLSEMVVVIPLKRHRTFCT